MTTEAWRNGPSSRAMRVLHNRNNLADLSLRKTLEQFDRERHYSMAHLDKDRFDMHDFLRHVQKRDNSPQESPESTECATSRPGKVWETKTAPPESRGGQSKVAGANANSNAKRTALMHDLMANTRRKKISDFERAELFLAKLRQKEEEEAINEQLEASGNFHHVFIREIRGHQSRGSQNRYPQSAPKPRAEVFSSGVDGSINKWALSVLNPGEEGQRPGSGTAGEAAPAPAVVARLNSRRSTSREARHRGTSSTSREARHRGTSGTSREARHRGTSSTSREARHRGTSGTSREARHRRTSGTSREARHRRTSGTLQHMGSLRLGDVSSHTDMSMDGMMTVVVNIPTSSVRGREKALDTRVQEFCQKLEELKRNNSSSRLVAIMPGNPHAATARRCRDVTRCITSSRKCVMSD